jgi:hypothetical protein
MINGSVGMRVTGGKRIYSMCPSEGLVYVSVLLKAAVIWICELYRVGK